MSKADIPRDLKYTRSHEWLRSEGNDNDTVVVGITQHAQEQLGDVVFVEMPEVGTQVTQGAPFGTVESVKAVSDLYAPVNGEVVARNESLTDAPESVNSDPYGAGWLLKLKLSTPTELEALLSAEAYAQLAGL